MWLAGREAGTNPWQDATAISGFGSRVKNLTDDLQNGFMLIFNGFNGSSARLIKIKD